MSGKSKIDDSPFTVRSRILIERGEEVVLSEWRVELLETIDVHGSLSQAAAALNIPNRTAWERVRDSEARLGVRLLESESGGSVGGGSRLTPEGRDLCQRFRRIANGVHAVISDCFGIEFPDPGG